MSDEQYAAERARRKDQLKVIDAHIQDAQHHASKADRGCDLAGAEQPADVIQARALASIAHSLLALLTIARMHERFSDD